MTETYRIGQPLKEGQSPLRVYRKAHFDTGKMVDVIEVFRPDGTECIGVDITESPELSDDDWHNRVVAPALAALNKRIAEKHFDVGPFTLDDFRNAA